MEYLAWNDLIAKHFFNEENAGREVLLYVNERLLETLGSDQSAGKDDFISALKNGPPWVTRQGFCQKALQACLDWRSKQLEYPPYIGYLAFFVLAGGVDAGFAPHAYYPNLWTLLGESTDKGTPPSFDEMILLWQDLEKWSMEDKHEALGRFVARIRGGWWKVGLPLSQTIISDEERKNLPGFFAGANLDPTDPPSPEVMAKLFNTYGHGLFEKKTLKILHDSGDEFISLRESLVDLVLDELECWDGIVDEDKSPDESKPESSRVQAVGMRICFSYDAVVQGISSYLRFKASKPFPEEGLEFERNGDPGIYSCKETFQGWSTPLKYKQDDSVRRLDASSVDWIRGDRFFDRQNEWHAKMRGAKTRLFRLNLDGMPDWIETQKLDRGVDFFIASHAPEAEKVRHWGASACDELKEIKASGMPHGWILFYGKNATESCEGIDVLSISRQVRLLLKEGIKAGRGNAFFNFAPPKIVVENGTGAELVTINGKPVIQRNCAEPVWAIPGEFLRSEDQSPGESLKVEVKTSDLSLSRIIRIVSFGLPASCEDTPFRDRFGQICDEAESSRVRGARAINVALEGPDPEFLPTQLSQKIIFIGCRPGEISEWPENGFPKEWRPVWALAYKKKSHWVVHFCGDLEDADNESGLAHPLGDRKKLKQWREALWVNRKITAGPELGILRKLWRKYMEAASHV
jgi:hypothetical protein